MSKKIKWTLKLLSYISIGILLVFAFLLAGIRLFGLEIYTVLSPSMEPNYPTGSLIYVNEVDYDSLQVGDVITFRLSGNATATHRIIECLPDGTYRTQGDNNDIPDGRPVSPSEVIGSPVFCVPLLGYLASFIQAPPGNFIAVGLIAAVLTFTFAVDLISDKNKKIKQTKQKENPKHEKN